MTLIERLQLQVTGKTASSGKINTQYKPQYRQVPLGALSPKVVLPLISTKFLAGLLFLWLPPMACILTLIAQCIFLW